MPDTRLAIDRLDEALDAGREVAERLAIPGDPSILSRTNNLVVRVGDAVLKIGTGATEGLRREVSLACHVANQRGPVLEPLADPIEVGDFLVSVWPYQRSEQRVSRLVGARSLETLHRSLATAAVPVPGLVKRITEVQDLLSDADATAALSHADRLVLRETLRRLPDLDPGAEVLLHGEPHDGNQLPVANGVIYVDLEAACRGPLEWDLAYFPEEVVADVWPDHDRSLCERLRVGVSACVSTYCWRYLTRRPDDNEMRWHAEHHLAEVRRTVTGSGR